LQRIFKEPDPWPDTEEDWERWSYHNFQRHETFEIAKVPMGKNIHEFITNTQEYQARLIKYAAESYRRQKYSPVTGIFQFMFCEDWPSINWGIVDYWRNPKLGYEALKTAFQPVLPSIEWEKDVWDKDETFRVDIWIINDRFKQFDHACLKYALIKDKKIILDNSLKLNIKPDSVQKVISIRQKGLDEGSYQLVTIVYDQKGSCLGQNSFKFTVKIKNE
jgi:beta-mannosidase